MVTAKVIGSFKNTLTFLNKCSKIKDTLDLTKYAEAGLNALKSATPKKTGLTADSWTYEIVEKNGNYTIQYNNNNIQNGINVAILLQYGHATKSGAYVQGIDYINPALKPIFDNIANTAWKELTND